MINILFKIRKCIFIFFFFLKTFPSLPSWHKQFYSESTIHFDKAQILSSVSFSAVINSCSIHITATIHLLILLIMLNRNCPLPTHTLSPERYYNGCVTVLYYIVLLCRGCHRRRNVTREHIIYLHIHIYIYLCKSKCFSPAYIYTCTCMIIIFWRNLGHISDMQFVTWYSEYRDI